jgi:hypothetical protein
VLILGCLGLGVLARLEVRLRIVLATTPIVWFAVTGNPDTAWVIHQSRNLA